MSLANIAIIGVFVLLLVLRMIPTKGVKQITTSDLKGYLSNNNIQFIDVRTPGEFKTNHIRQFKNIPLHLLAQKTAELSHDKDIIVICQSGMRSNKASKLLKKAGFNNIINVKGGMSAWN
ncbi:rhodanese-like domain-containing protein [Bacillus sp. 1NLA3E]|uniref:rhodanese-like domain-containing protein n=1 Tax=Bacillus sp. 1NLA3E TaxID=666686 RepID=UPI000247EB7E|nr:rhodanese-like domain-containing protein [Bacillus sp. 1NLA3E]AGK55771.1 Rhodanese-like protein [Bacillus sp. 1NLA3E]